MRNSDILWRQDLANLPEPRVLDVTPDWFRLFVAALAGMNATIGGTVLGGSLIRWSFDPLASALGAVALIGGAAIWVLSKPEDRRQWINLAATPDGLYLPARKRRAVFVPWSTVSDIAIYKWYGKGGEHSAVKLTLELPEETWARFSPLASIEGSGTVRTFLVRSLSPAERLAEQFKVLRRTSPADRTP